MPKKHTPARNANARLAGLPRRADLVIEGGRRTLGMYLRDGKEVFQPEIVIWLESESGMIRNSEVLPPTKDQASITRLALNTLVAALTQPTPLTVIADNAPLSGPPGKRPEKKPFQPCLPGKIIINDAALAEAAKTFFGPLHVPVEYKEDLPRFNDAFQSLSEHLGADEEAGPPEPFEWDMPFAVVSPLFAAATAYWRRAPWNYLPDYPPIELKLGENGPQPGVETLYASILGGLGMLPGVAFYYSLEALDRFMSKSSEMMPPADDQTIDEAIGMLRQAGVPVDQLPPDEVRLVLGQILGDTAMPEGEEKWELVEDGLACLFNPKDECDPTYLEWMEAHRLKSPSREGVPNFLKTVAGQEPMNPDQREVKAMTLALEALNQFFSHFHSTLQEPLTPNEPLTYQARLADGIVVDVSYTPQEIEEDEEDVFDDEEEDIDEADFEPDTPASEAATTTLYRFQVKLAWMKSVWRRIEMRGDQTLHDLHKAIQDAFHWDDDHLYAFFLSGRDWDEKTSYESPLGDGERNAAKYRLEHLPLKPGQEFLYLFDFGDELRHLVKLEAITPGKAQPGVDYPKITEEHGEAPPQYPMLDDEE